MLTRPQQILLKRAQAQAGIDDAEYRSTLETLTGCRSSKDAAMGDESLDALLSYFEAVYWRGVDAGRLKAPSKGNEPFLQRGFWATRNKRGNTSRDRYTKTDLAQSIARLEAELSELGLGASYSAAIREKVTRGRGDAGALNHYRVALERTLKSKQKATEQPF